jgi:hypothetical protein
MPRMAAYRVFLSHGSQDRRLVQELVLPAIVDAGAEVFLDDQCIQYGDDFRRIILRELRRCEEAVVVLTASSMARPWVCAEIGGTLLRRQRVVPMTYGVTETVLASAGVLSLVGSINMLKIGPASLARFTEQLRARVADHV